MTQEELQESSLSDLENELSKVKNRHQQLVQERIHVQVEHDAIQSYREITKQSIHHVNLQQKIREFDVHGERDDMAVEIKAYQDKVKQLNFHHELQLEDAQKERNETLQSIRDENDERLGQAEQKKQSLLDQLREQQIANVQEIVQMKQGYENDFENERAAMKARLDELRKSCADHYQNIEDDLVLRRRVQMREIQEQGNSHIFDLEMRQSETYEKTKVYYEGVSRDNKITIQKLEDTLQKLEMKDSQYKEEIRKISEINEQMRSPLERCLAEVKIIRDEVKDKEKNQQALKGMRTRQVLAEKRLEKQTSEYNCLQKKYDLVQREIIDLQNQLNDCVNLDSTSRRYVTSKTS